MYGLREIGLALEEEPTLRSVDTEARKPQPHCVARLFADLRQDERVR